MVKKIKRNTALPYSVLGKLAKSSLLPDSVTHANSSGLQASAFLSRFQRVDNGHAWETLVEPYCKATHQSYEMISVYMKRAFNEHVTNDGWSPEDFFVITCWLLDKQLKFTTENYTTYKTMQDKGFLAIGPAGKLSGRVFSYIARG